MIPQCLATALSLYSQ